MPKIAVVTGAEAGVGRATAWEFARQGYDVALLSRDANRLDSAASERKPRLLIIITLSWIAAQSEGDLSRRWGSGAADRIGNRATHLLRGDPPHHRNSVGNSLR